MNIYEIKEEIAGAMAEHKDNMITEAIYRHYKVFTMTLSFADIARMF
jgi:hypothetical protein